MKTVFALLSIILLAASVSVQAQEPARPKKQFELYAQFLEDTRVDLSDGAVWMMDKGDCFPIYMFKDQQTKIVLKIASATFQVDAAKMKVLPESQNEMALNSYRKNLADYLNGQPNAWVKEAKGAKDTAKKKSGPTGEKVGDKK